MKTRHTTDMTQGTPLSLLVRFALPLVLGALLQQLYSFADTAIVGRCISADALTAVGITAPLHMLILGFALGCAAGCSIPLAQYVGGGGKDDVCRAFWNGLYLCAAMSLGLGLVMSRYAGALLTLLNTPAHLRGMAETYLRIVLAGQGGTVLYNYLSGTMRALGDAKRPLYFLLLSSGMNILLDLALVGTFGVAGAAAATVTCQALSAALCALWLLKNAPALRPWGGKAALSAPHLRQMAAAGIPMGLEYSVCSVGNLVLQRSINTLGAAAATAQVCGERIRAIATLPLESVGMATATYMGQNYGAKRFDRIRSGLKAGMVIQAVYATGAWAALAVLKKPLVAVLLGETTSPQARSALQYLSVISLLFVFHGGLMVLRNTVRGMGLATGALAATAMEVVGRGGAGALAVATDSFLIICLSAPAAWALALACCAVLCAVYLPKLEKAVSGSERPDT